MARGILGLLGGRRNLGGLLDSIGVECGCNNIGVPGLRRFRGRMIWFSGGSWEFSGIFRVTSG